MKSLPSSSLALVVAAFFVRPCLAASPTELDEIVITASRMQSTSKDLPGRTTVVSSEEIELMHPRAIDDMLTRTAALVDLQGNADTNQLTRKIMLYGVGDQQRTLVLLDGIPIQAPATIWADWHIIHPRTVDHVEVLRGPYSGQYGSGAMGGVVQIVTKIPTKPAETILDGSYGTHEAMEFNAYHGGKRGPVAYYLAGRFFQTDGFINVPVVQPYHVKSDRLQHNITSKVVWSAAEKTTVTAGYAQARDILNAGRLWDNDDRVDLLGYLRVEQGLGSWRTRATGFVGEFHEYLELDTVAPAYARSAYRLRNQNNFGGDFQASGDVGGGVKLLAGLDGKVGRFDETIWYLTGKRSLRGKGKQTYLAPYLQAESKWFDDKLTATLGVRVDWFRSHGGVFHDNTATKEPIFYGARTFHSILPRGGLVFRPDDKTALRAAFGRAFAAPQPTSLFVQTIRNKTNLPDPTLNPEKFWSYEVGAERKLAEGLKTDVSFHQGWGEDFVTAILLPSGNSQWGNVASIGIVGVDANAEYRFYRDWTAKLAYGFQRSKIEKYQVNTTLEGADYTYVPPNKVLFALSYDNPDIVQGDFRVRYTDHTFADVNHVFMAHKRWNLDLGASRRIWKGVTARVELLNLLNDRYDVFDLASAMLSAPGLLATGTLSVTF